MFTVRSSYLKIELTFYSIVEPKKEGKKDAPAKVAPAGKSKSKAKDKAMKTRKNVVKGIHSKRSRKIRTSVHFYRPKTLSLPRQPKYPRKSIPRTDRYCLIELVLS